MCGIAGYWGTGTREVLTEMGNSLTHRGPDDGGVLEVGPVGLAHRRLSIVDLSPAGHQPMQNTGGSVSLVFNGEIYNYKELRDTFLRGYSFRGTSDTEVLLYLYEELGEAFLKKIQGMFALALYDTEKGVLLLARDHMGKKPLYWAQSAGTLIFGSELKALRKHPLCPREINKGALAEYLINEYVKSPGTIYTDIFKLPPGTYLTFDGKNVVQGSFSEGTPPLGSYEGDFRSAKSELYALLDTAVKKRMVADVPVGVFLSGGLDSSTIAYFAQKSSERKVKTFSIGFSDASFDESAYAREVARTLGTEHYERTVTPHDLEGMIQKVPYVLDEPMADSSIVPTLILSEFTSSEVKVVLGGDGADELLWGYDTFFAHHLGAVYEKVPRWVHRGLTRVIENLPVSHGYMSLDFKAKKFLSGFDTTRAQRNTYWLSAFTPEELSLVCNFDVDREALLTPTDSLYGHDSDFWESLQTEYVEGYLAEDILVKTDRAGMAYGLEVRAPFLDVNLVDFARSLPARYKYRGLSGKRVLREMMREHLPASVTRRKKKGFNVPIGAWIKEELRELFTETLLEGELVSSGLFKRSGIAILLESHVAGEFDHRKKLWTLFVLALWMKTWNE